MFFNGSHRGVVNFVEERLRDPDSFDHVETRITPIDENGQHTLMMQYRAANGFGGIKCRDSHSPRSTTLTAVQLSLQFNSYILWRHITIKSIKDTACSARFANGYAILSQTALHRLCPLLRALCAYFLTPIEITYK